MYGNDVEMMRGNLVEIEYGNDVWKFGRVNHIALWGTRRMRLSIRTACRPAWLSMLGMLCMLGLDDCEICRGNCGPQATGAIAEGDSNPKRNRCWGIVTALVEMSPRFVMSFVVWQLCCDHGNLWSCPFVAC